MFSFKLLLAQIAIILSAARLLGWLFRKLHQPRVIGEMLAGILLGPSLLGWAAPNLSAALFPAASLPALSALSQLGLLLFMFLIGLELDLKQVRELGRVAVVTSQASIVVPFVLGCLLAGYLYPRFADPHVNLTAFVLFIGTAISITAFPVLARILAERDLLRTKVGALAITCAAINDATAWGMLAGIVVLVRASDQSQPLWPVFLVLGGYVVLMFVVVKPALQKLVPRYARRQELSHEMLALILLTVLASGWITEALGIHALFGAFLAGLVMPRQSDLSQALWLRIEALIVVLLLPLYFALTGLRSSIFLITGGRWLSCALIIGTAIAGKLGGSTLAARFTGLSWREATAVGVLLNTRGMVELVILNIGLDLGIISPTLFSIMVLMALVTTLMAAPLLHWVYPEKLAKRTQT
ncbi:MAG: cation:proton antiporter [Acidobacteria bacterium]|nr:cation:proton antiporter [Acidobacteriota bacterium]MBI3423708.1 cation:proton antiporter [Acidobacteriota bacterium]